MSLTNIVGPIAACALFLFVGVACLVGSVWFGVRDYNRARTWCVADALVIGYAKARPGPDDDGPYFKQVLEFSDAEGKRIRVRSTSAYGGRFRRKVGKTVRVCYPPGHPHKARIIGENRGSYWLVGIGGAAIAAVAGVGMASILSGATGPAEPSAGSLHDLFGEAAFGLHEEHVVLVVLTSVLLLIAWGAARQQSWPGEIAFLIAVAGGLVSSPTAMVIIMLGCLVGALGMGAVLTWMGVKTRLTPEQNARVQGLLHRASKELDPESPE